MKTLAPSSAQMIPLDPVGLYTHTARLLNEKIGKIYKIHALSKIDTIPHGADRPREVLSSRIKHAMLTPPLSGAGHTENIDSLTMGPH